MRRATGKSQNQIAKEWGRIAKLRVDQIEKGRDLSFTFVLVPCILELAGQSNLTAVVDIGCGAGFLTEQIGNRAREVLGIDMSPENIGIATQRCVDIGNIEFVSTTIEDYSRTVKSPRFTLATANMFMMTTLHLDRVLKSIARILKPGAHFVFTITHPCFWPFYWQYLSQNWFDYKKEIAIEAPFKISLETSPAFTTTHIHRPLEQYVLGLSKAGFVIEEICEPVPKDSIEAKYPKRWPYPRFLGRRCVRR